MDELVAQHASGLTIQQLAQEFNLHRTTVMNHLEGRDVQRRQIVRKMTDEQVAAAAHQYAGGRSLAAVAAVFKVHARTLSREFRLAGWPVRPRKGWPQLD